MMQRALHGRGDSQETNMVKVSVMYPNQAGANFDHGYYRDRHMPMVAAKLGAKVVVGRSLRP
jgi:uncharacterized protein (TIGR02118 family)